MYVFVTIPFRGHYNAMERAAREWLKRGEDVVLIVLTWKDVPAPGIEKMQEDSVHRTDKLLEHSRVILEAKDVPLDSSSPTQFTWDRCEALVDRLYSWCGRQNVIGTIDWIIYDFFCPEALIVADKMRIPSVCSIPAVPGTTWTPFHRNEAHKLQTQLDRISHRWQMRPSLSQRLFPLSDSFYVSGSNRQWIWCHPLIYRRQDYARSSGFTNITMMTRTSTQQNDSKQALLRKDSFPQSQRKKEEQQEHQLVYVCLGTVVTGNLWDKNSNARKCASLVYACVSEWAERRKEEVRVIICAPGLPLDDELHAIYGKDVFVTSVDQVALLRDPQTAIFVTHGGGNSVAEALDAGVPMLVVPFFGDQHVCSKRVQRYGFGFSFGRPDAERAVDTRCELPDPRLFQADQLHVLLEHLWSEKTNVRTRILQTFPSDGTGLSSLVLSPVPIDQATLPSDVVCFKRGDLLYGTNVARHKFAKVGRCEGAHSLKSCENLSPFASDSGKLDERQTWESTLCVGDTRPPSTRLSKGLLPALIDHYNDVLRLPLDSSVRLTELSLNRSGDNDDNNNNNNNNDDANTKEYSTRLHALDSYYREKHFPSQTGWFKRHSYPPSTLEALWFACCGGLAYFLIERRDTCVHFVVHEDFDSDVNRATALELRWLKQHWTDEMSSRVRFYWLRTNDSTNNSTLEPCSPVLMQWFEWRRDQIAQKLETVANWSVPFQKSLVRRVQTVVSAAQREFGALYFQKRVKTPDSMYEKIHVRFQRSAFIDCIGMRIVHLWTENLFCLQPRIVDAVTSSKEFVLVRIRVTERARVQYLYFWNNRARLCLEIQLWPTTLHTCLEYEHESVYKSGESELSEEKRSASLALRQEEHKLQDLVDQRRLLHDAKSVQ